MQARHQVGKVRESDLVDVGVTGAQERFLQVPGWTRMGLLHGHHPGRPSMFINTVVSLASFRAARGIASTQRATRSGSASKREVFPRARSESASIAARGKAWFVDQMMDS